MNLINKFFHIQIISSCKRGRLNSLNCCRWCLKLIIFSFNKTPYSELIIIGCFINFITRNSWCLDMIFTHFTTITFLNLIITRLSIIPCFKMYIIPFTTIPYFFNPSIPTKAFYKTRGSTISCILILFGLGDTKYVCNIAWPCSV